MTDVWLKKKKSMKINLFVLEKGGTELTCSYVTQSYKDAQENCKMSGRNINIPGVMTSMLFFWLLRDSATFCNKGLPGFIPVSAERLL